MATRMTPEAMDRSYEMSASLQERNQLPDWMYSPPTPGRAERIEPGPDGKPPADAVSVVECGNGLYDRIVLHRIHSHSLRLPHHVSPLLRAFFTSWWEDYATDENPENRDVRAQILTLAAEERAGSRADRTRAWRTLDWEARVETPALLELAGFADLARAYRSLPDLTGPNLPREAVRLFRTACRETDRASSLAMKGKRESRRWAPSRGGCGGRLLVHHLRRAVGTTFRDLYRMIEEDVHSRMTPLGLGLLAGGYARICIDYTPRLGRSAVARTKAKLDEAGRALVADVLAIGGASRAAA
jgi:hypothetical protein